MTSSSPTLLDLGEQHTVLLVKRIPPEIPLQAVTELFQQYGAIAVRHLTSPKMRNMAFVDFPSREASTKAYFYLQQLELGPGRKLKVEYATPNMTTPVEKQTVVHTIPNPIEFLSPQHIETPNGSSIQMDSILEPDPISADLGLSYPSNPHLYYRYPPPTPVILTNILHAIQTVPKLYTQILHLMNKMNLPPPFTLNEVFPNGLLGGMVVPGLPTAEGIKTGKGNSLKRPLSEHRKAEGDIEEEEEEEEEESPTLKKPKMDELEAHNLTDNKEANIPMPELDAQHQYVTIQELSSYRLSSEEIKNTAAFRNYSPGEPSRTLYIKNLSPKQCSVEDLEYLFGRYFESRQEMESQLEIRLLREGRMKGQAFVKFPSLDLAAQALRDVHGYVLHGKPMVIMFGKSNS